MNLDALVSVIIPVYNSKKYILKCLNSVLEQDYKNFEIIIVDDCSNNETFDFLIKLKKKYKFKLYKTKKNSGTVAAPRNLGVKYAKGHYLTFLDSDDYWHKSFLSTHIKTIKNKKTLSFTAAKYISEDEKKISNFFLNTFRKWLQNFFINKINKSKNSHSWFYIYNPIIVSSVFINKEYFKDLKFNQDIFAREDLEMWINLKKKNFKFVFIDKYLTFIRRRHNSLSSNKKKEFFTIVRSLSNSALNKKDFKNLNFFLFGIVFKFLTYIIKINKIKIKKYFLNFSILIIFLFFLFFYTPFFWYLGKPLLYYNDIKQIKNYNTIVVFSGHGSIDYFNMTYKERYYDIKKIIKENPNIKHIYLLGRATFLPSQKIIESLLLTDGIKKEKINVIYKEFNSTEKNIKNVLSILDKKSINDFIFVTAPYHSKRAYLLFKKYKKNVFFWKGDFWPTKNNFFEYSKNKKIIIYEYLSIILNFFKKNIII